MARTIAIITLLSGAAVLLLAWPQRPQAQSCLRLPFFFESNSGQAPAGVRYLGRTGDSTLSACDDELVLRTRAGTLHLRPQGGRVARPRGEQPLPGRVHYLGGRQSVVGVRTCASVRYPQVYPGIDLIWTGLQHRWVVAPGADPGRIAMTYDGCQRLEVDENGNLVQDGGRLLQTAPRIHQGPTRVEGHYQSRGPLTVGFSLGAFDPRRELVIESPAPEDEPEGHGTSFVTGGRDGRAYVARLEGEEMVYTAYLEFGDEGYAVAADQAGQACVAGRDFVARLRADGAGLLFARRLEGATGVTLDLFGQAYVTGQQAGDAYVTKLNERGEVVWTSVVGGSATDAGRCVGVDAAGCVYVAGSTASDDLPVRNAFQNRRSGQLDGFAAKLSSDGQSVLYCTYLGGSQADAVTALALDASGQAVLAGTTSSADFPTTLGAFQDARQGQTDAWVARLNGPGGGLVFSTYLGEPGSDDRCGALRLGPAGEICVAGSTLQHGRRRTFATVLDPTGGSALVPASAERLTASQ